MKEPITEELKQTCLEFQKDPVAGGKTWKDVTSYSQNTKEKIPTVWECRIGDFQIIILCQHMYYPNQWVFHCHKLDFNQSLLVKAKTAKQAAEMAIEKCKDKVLEMCKSFEIELK